MNIPAKGLASVNNRGMQLTSRQDFPAPPSDVFAMLTDEAFLRHAATEMGSPDARVAASASRTAVEATIESPAEVRAFVGPTLRILLDVDWGAAEPDGGRAGTFSMTVPGTPVTVAGRTRLAPTASGSELVYDGDLEVKVPLIGGRIEKEAAPAILEALDAQARVGRAWLARP